MKKITFDIADNMHGHFLQALKETNRVLLTQAENAMVEDLGNIAIDFLRQVIRNIECAKEIQIKPVVQEIVLPLDTKEVMLTNVATEIKPLTVVTEAEKPKRKRRSREEMANEKKK